MQKAEGKDTKKERNKEKSFGKLKESFDFPNPTVWVWDKGGVQGQSCHRVKGQTQSKFDITSLATIPAVPKAALHVQAVLQHKYRRASRESRRRAAKALWRMGPFNMVLRVPKVGKASASASASASTRGAIVPKGSVGLVWFQLGCKSAPARPPAGPLGMRVRSSPSAPVGMQVRSSLGCSVTYVSRNF